MFAMIIKRIFSAIPVLLIIATLTFCLVRVVPGGPFDEDKNLPPEIIKNLEAKYNLDKPIAEQYLLYLGRLVRGTSGSPTSMSTAPLPTYSETLFLFRFNWDLPV